VIIPPDQFGLEAKPIKLFISDEAKAILGLPDDDALQTELTSTLERIRQLGGLSYTSHTQETEGEEQKVDPISYVQKQVSRKIGEVFAQAIINNMFGLRDREVDIMRPEHFSNLFIDLTAQCMIVSAQYNGNIDILQNVSPALASDNTSHIIGNDNTPLLEKCINRAAIEGLSLQDIVEQARVRVANITREELQNYAQTTAAFNGANKNGGRY